MFAAELQPEGKHELLFCFISICLIDNGFLLRHVHY